MRFADHSTAGTGLWIRDAARTKQIAPAMNVIRIFDTNAIFSEQQYPVPPLACGGQ